MKARFVIHEHHATNLHFDLRLEIGGVLKSWAVPKGVSMNAADKRLAIEVPDHSLSYIDFEGTISEGKYGAGRVAVWDNGWFETKDDAARQLANGRLNFAFHGAKLRGWFSLVRMKGRDKQWLIIKTADEFAAADWTLETVLPPKANKKSSADEHG